jgi:hypothetical protein
MTIDGKSFVIGAIAGYCVLLLKATVAVEKDRLKKEKVEEKA